MFDESKILLHLKNSQSRKTFSDLLDLCDMPKAAERTLDKNLQRMRRAGLIEFNRKTREWEALVAPTEAQS